jgi:magnesium transporter
MNASATQETRWLHFDPSEVQDVQLSNPTSFIQRPEAGVHWVNFLGYPEESTWLEWREVLGLNPHMMMDAVDAKQRPLMEEYPEALFLSVKSIVKRKGSRVKMEHISFVLTNDYVLSIQQKVQDRFEAVYTRIQEGRGIVRQRSVDYLLYRLLEAVIAPYGMALGSMEDHLEKLELAVVQSPSPEVMTQVLQLKRDLTNLRRALIPMKEVLGSIETSAFIKAEHHPYFRDVRDQAMQCVDRMDSLRSMLESLESLYLSSVGQRTNEVMRVLTVFSAIFLPITFLAGLYGMNFQNMPETETQNGYFVVLSIMCATVGGMLWWMRRKGWI